MITRGYPLSPSSQNDVIILGAGIAGLLLASELSQNCRVLIVEKESRIPERKYWLTPKACLELNPEFQHCIDSQYSFLEFIAYDRTRYRCLGDYILWDTQLLINFLVRQIESRGGKILKGHEFYSYRSTKHGLVVEASDLELHTRLLVDCMGFASPIVFAEDVVRIRGYYFLYGSVIKLKRIPPPICLANVMISEKPKYLEVFPTRSGEAYAAVLAPADSMRAPDNLQKDFEFIVRQSKYKDYFIEDATPNRILSGIIPVGYMRKRAVDRIVFYGEAGQVHPAATGACLTRMMRTYRKTASFLRAQLESDRLTASDLSQQQTASEKFNLKFQLCLFDQVLHWKSNAFSDLLNKMQEMENSLVNSVLFGDVQIPQVLNQQTLINLLRTRNTFVLTPFVRALLPQLFI